MVKKGVQRAGGEIFFTARSFCFFHKIGSFGVIFMGFDFYFIVLQCIKKHKGTIRKYYIFHKPCFLSFHTYTACSIFVMSNESKWQTSHNTSKRNNDAGSKSD